MPPQFVLFDEKSGGATAQQSLCGIALSEVYRPDISGKRELRKVVNTNENKKRFFCVGFYHAV